MTQRKFDEEMIHELYQAFVKIDSEAACAQFLEDLCTRKEVEQMAQRLRAAKLLVEGKTYTQVIEQTNIPPPPSAGSPGASSTAKDTGNS